MIPMGRWRTIGRLVGSALLLAPSAACGVGGGDASNGVTAAADGKADSGHESVAAGVVDDYFDALQRRRYREMVGLSTGPAALAADYGVAVQRANPDAFAEGTLTVEQPPSNPRRDGNRISFAGEYTLAVPGGGASGEPESTEEQVRFSEFVTIQQDGRWLLESYHRDARPLTDFVASGSGEARAGDITVVNRVVFYDRSKGVLVIPFELRNEGDTSIGVASLPSLTVNETERRYTAASREGPGEVDPASTGDLSVLFINVDDAADGGVRRSISPMSHRPVRRSNCRSPRSSEVT
jgi:hypothetical protein